MFIPENIIVPELFYEKSKIKELFSSNRSIKLQTNLSLRALDLLGPPDQRKPMVFLDIGCGTGLTQAILKLKKNFSIGLDIVFQAIKVSEKKKEKGMDFLLVDLETFILPLKKKKIDFFISISVFQWVKNYMLSFRGSCSFNEFWKKIKKEGRSIVQFYPSDFKKLKSISGMTDRTNERSFLFVDNPRKKKKRKFFVLIRGKNIA